MTVLFDASASQPDKGGTHGGGEYAIAVLRRLTELGRPGDIELLLDGKRNVPDVVAEMISNRLLSVTNYDSRDQLQHILRETDASRFYSALPYGFSDLDFSNLDVVFTVHGIRPVELPTDANEWRFAGSASEIAKCFAKALGRNSYSEAHRKKFANLLNVRAKSMSVVVPSEYTLSVMRKFRVLREDTDVRVRYSPVTDVARYRDTDNSVIAQTGLSKNRYFLMVSGKRWIKNTYRGIAAWQHAKRHCPSASEFKLAIAGGCPRWVKKRWKDEVTVLPYVSTAGLRSLYANAYALLYPTLNEGFGYPPLEAMTCGTPVLASRVCSVPEVLGDSAIYFSPNDVAEISDAIVSLINDPDLRARKAKEAIDRAAAVQHRQDSDLDDLCHLILE